MDGEMLGEELISAVRSGAHHCVAGTGRSRLGNRKAEGLLTCRANGPLRAAAAELPPLVVVRHDLGAVAHSVIDEVTMQPTTVGRRSFPQTAVDRGRAGLGSE